MGTFYTHITLAVQKVKMRTKKAAINTFFAVLMQVVTVLLNLVSKRIFVDILGGQIYGLNSLFNTIIIMLSLTELGIGMAITYSLYKPLAENNQKQIIALMTLYKKVYHYIALIVLCMGLLLIPFLRFLIKEDFSTPFLAKIFIPFVLSASVSYLMSYKKTLLIADQKGYIVTIVRTIYLIALHTTQIAILLLTHNFIAYLLAKVVLDFLDSLVCYKLCDRHYPFQKNATEQISTEDKNLIVQKVKALVYHRVGIYLINGIDSIIITKYLGTVINGYYTNYMIIINTVTELLGQVSNGLTASMGNLVASESKDRVFNVFKRVLLFNYFLVSFCATCFAVLINPFISIWMSPDVLLDKYTVAVLIINFYITTFSYTIGALRASAGIFEPDKYLHVVLAIVNLVVSIGLLKLIGIAGVFIGTLICLIIKEIIALPYIMGKHFFKTSTFGYYKRFFLYGICTMTIVAVTMLISSFVNIGNAYFTFLVKALICLTVPNIINLLLFFKTREFKELCEHFLSLIKRN